MSSGSSDVDVKKTQISAGDDEHTVLYAFEPNTSHIRDEERNLPDISNVQDQQRSILEVLNNCQTIQDAIKNLEKKVDVIRGKIAKIHRVRVKSLWQSRRSYGYGYRNYRKLLSRKSRLQKLRKRDLSPSKSSYCGSYSPTVPVGRRDSDYYDNAMQSPYHSENSLEQAREAVYDQNLHLSQSLSNQSSSFLQSYQPYYTADNLDQSYSSMHKYSGEESQGTNSVFSPTQASIAVSPDVTAQDRLSAVHNPEMITQPPLLEKKNFHCAAASTFIPVGYSTTVVETNVGMLKESCSGDPTAWSIEEVILFLKCVDPHILTHIADIFRQHAIDGKALLLLNSDMMMKYLGLKLGTAVKLCHQIEKLKGGKYINY